MPHPASAVPRLLPVLAATALLAAAAGPAQAQLKARADNATQFKFRNLTAGGLLRHGVYGRIAVEGEPPPVIHAQPVVAAAVPGRPGAEPVYLYVPGGQVRKWTQHCHRWSACEQPVFFVRMDDSPSRLGEWRLLREREQYALRRDN